jgi:hypothetical protein
MQVPLLVENHNLRTRGTKDRRDSHQSIIIFCITIIMLSDSRIPFGGKRAVDSYYVDGDCTRPCWMALRD